MRANNKTLACTVKDSLNQQILEVAEKKKLKKSQIMRVALQEYLEEGFNRPAEAALLVQMCNQIEATDSVFFNNQDDNERYQDLSEYN